MVDPTYTCNSLTSFESEADAINENNNYTNLQKLNCKNCEITSGEFIFGEFQLFGTTVRAHRQKPIPLTRASNPTHVHTCHLTAANVINVDQGQFFAP